jgi:hypothetical protein
MYGQSVSGVLKSSSELYQRTVFMDGVA